MSSKANQPLKSIEEIARYVFLTSAGMNMEAFEKVLAYCADDILMDWPYRAPNAPDKIKGKDACRAFFQSVVGLMEFTLTVDNVLVDERQNTTVLLGHSKGKNARTGRPYANRYVMIFVFRNGLITEWHEYVNPLAAMAAESTA